MSGLAPLTTTIASIRFFDNPTPITFNNKISEYHGERLFCKAVMDRSSLSIFIDENGPSTTSVSAINLVKNGTLVVRYKGATTEVVTLKDFTYTPGEFLLLTATLSPDEQSLRINLQSSTNPQRVGAELTPVGYVIAISDVDPIAPSRELRWIDIPVQRTTEPDQAVVRPAPDPATVGGVSGPIGLQTPP